MNQVKTYNKGGNGVMGGGEYEIGDPNLTLDKALDLVHSNIL